MGELQMNVNFASIKLWIFKGAGAECPVLEPPPPHDTLTGRHFYPILQAGTGLGGTGLGGMQTQLSCPTVPQTPSSTQWAPRQTRVLSGTLEVVVTSTHVNSKGFFAGVK